MYVNNLISLQENISTYGIDDRKVTGHVTLSSPGMIKCYVQNLKALPSGNRYVFCIFSKNHNEGIKVGKLGTEKETKWIVDEKNILGSGLRLEEIDGVALVAEHEMRGAEAVVVGFSRDRYMLLSMVDSLFPRNEQKSTNQVSPKTVTKQPTGTVEKPKVVVKEPMPVEKPKIVVKEPEPEEKVKVIVVKEPVPVEKPKVMAKEPVPVEKPKAVVQEPGPVILPVPVVAEKTISIEKIKVVVSQESGPVILPKPKVPMEPGPVILPKPKVPLEPGPVILPCEHKEEYMHKEMPYEHKEEHMHKEMPCEHKEEYMHKEMPCEHKEEHMHKEMPCEHKEEHMHKEMPCEHKEEYMHKEMPCEHKEEAQQSICKPICKPICPKPRVEEQEDFILPEGTVVGDLTKETSTEPITKELKRIIDSISKDKRVEEKARELEEQISKMSNIPQSQKLFDKAHIQKTIESRYMSQQINIEDMLEEEEEEPGLDTNPKKAIECINEMSEVEGLLDSEALEERDYLLEIDKRLQAIRARMGEAIEKQELE